MFTYNICNPGEIRKNTNNYWLKKSTLSGIMVLSLLIFYIFRFFLVNNIPAECSN